MFQKRSINFDAKLEYFYVGTGKTVRSVGTFDSKFKYYKIMKSFVYKIIIIMVDTFL